MIYPINTAQMFAIRVINKTTLIPILSLAHTDIEVFYKKEDAVVFTQKSMTVANWTETQHGIYLIDFTSDELNTAGQFVFYAYRSDSTNELHQIQIELLSHNIGIEKAELTVQDQSSNPIQGVAISISDSTDSTTLTYASYTNVNGLINVYLPVGVYKVRMYKSFVEFTLKDLTVTSGGTAVTYQGATFNPAAQTSPSICLLYGYIKDLTNENVEDVVVYVYIYEKGTFINNNGILLGSKKIETDSSGYFSVSLIRELDVILEIKDQGYIKRFTVPDSASVDYSTL